MPDAAILPVAYTATRYPAIIEGRQPPCSPSEDVVQVVAQVNEPALDAQETQDSDLEGGTPQEQPAPQAPAATSSKVPVDVPRLQSEYTKVSQRWSEVARALDLPKDTPVDVVISRLAELQTPRGEDDAVMDPETLRRQRTLESREWAAEQAIYGETAIHAQTFYEKVRKYPNMPPSEVMTVFAAAVEAAAEARTAGAPPSEEAAPEPRQPDFREEAPLTQPGQGDLDPAQLAGKSKREQEDGIANWLRKGLQRR
jgi:hypothetical protein